MLIFRLALLVVFAWIGGLAPSAAQDQRIRMVTAPPPGSPPHRGSELYMDLVNKRLAGKAEIVRLEGTNNALARVRDGEAEIAIISSAAFAASKTPSMALYDLPFFFSDLMELRDFQTAGLGDAILAEVAGEGVVGLSYWNSGMSQLVGRSDLFAAVGPRALSDLRGKKIRTNVSPIGQSAARMIGLAPTQLAFAEVAMAVQTGTIDFFEAPNTALNLIPALTEATSISEVNYRPLVSVVVVNAKYWKNASLRVQLALAEEARGVAKSVSENAIAENTRARDGLKTRNVKLITFSPDDLTAFSREAEVGWKLIPELQSDRLLDDALMTRAALRATPKVQRRGDNTVRGEPTRLLFATDRKVTEDNDPGLQLGGARGNMSYGHVNMLPSASSSAILKSIDYMNNSEEFVEAIRMRIATSPRKELLIYVHGYNNTFKQAAEAARTLSLEVFSGGVPIVFSWPSDGAAFNYLSDEDEVRSSRNGFVELLQKMQGINTIERINVLTHSMGGRLLTDSLDWMSAQQADKQGRLFHLILAAADIDRTLFLQTKDALKKQATRISLYASQWDQPLICSRWLHRGKQNEARVGQGGSDTLVVNGIDTIDTSPVETPTVTIPCYSGHTYVTQNAAVLSDVSELLTTNLPPSERSALTPVEKNGLRYWQLTK